MVFRSLKSSFAGQFILYYLLCVFYFCCSSVLDKLWCWQEHDGGEGEEVPNESGGGRECVQGVQGAQVQSAPLRHHLPHHVSHQGH